MKHPNPTSHSYFSQRLRLHYADWGGSGSPPMLLVHGVQDHCRSWDWFAEAFCDRFHVVAPDLRGHGDSEWVRGSSYHHLDYVYDLDQLVRQRGLAPSVVVSHSMGGTLASILAGVYPDAVTALVIIEGVGLWPGWNGGGDPAARIDEWIRTTRSLASRLPRRYATLEEAYSRMQQANDHLSPEQARHLTVHGSHRNEDGTYSWKFDNYTHAWPAYRMPVDDLTALWSRITCPVLIINGGDGFPHRIGQDGTLDHFADAEVIDVPGAGHWAHHDEPDAVIEHVEAFLRRRGAFA
ncbi:MAG: alpha/beta hydrolase [Gammaproteobacteria bacterium]|jgi:pimeloyl-ACP methyl ester carboxylesterase|nr:alpha/beta hydrolase [Gammaproteobacteria bacterium]|tara:strand:+ start:264 stop:1145 length:882 start_codon:yes stop_codon:yes gene_type:complete